MQGFLGVVVVEADPTFLVPVDHAGHPGMAKANQLPLILDRDDLGPVLLKPSLEFRR